MLKLGASGDAVTHYQKALRRSGADLRITGNYDDKTLTAVIGFQTANGLPPTGQIDGVTADLLSAELWVDRDQRQRKQIQKIKAAVGLPTKDEDE